MRFIERLKTQPLAFADPSARRALDAGLPNASPLRAAPRWPQAESFLLGVFRCSPFLAGLSTRDPAALAEALTREPEAHLASIVADMTRETRAASTHAEAMRALRRAKRRAALLIALCEIGGVWPVDEAAAALSSCADALIAEAARFLLAEAAARGAIDSAADDPAKGSGYIILAMGKLGACELNYSSDIDLIVFYDAETAPLAAGVEPGPFFVRLTRDLVKLLNERTADGYVFRTDLRLRPDPGSTQIALSTAAAAHYYESAGQNWERAAFIKARAAAGDLAAGERFLAALSPYVWRKYLDYAAIADIHAMKRQIHAHKGHGAVAVAGHNIKLGRGGIREIEFFVQTQQLIAGGRQPDLRVRGTLDALDALVARGWISASSRDDLREAYCFLRMVEHRLQMRNDEQTHTLPTASGDLELLAQFCGFQTAAAFAAALTERLLCVERHYAKLFETAPDLAASSAQGSLVFTGAGDDPATLETLAAMGFKYPASVAATVRGWHYGRYPAMRSARARERLTEMTPALLDALARTSNPDQALASFDAFMAQLPAGVQLFSLIRNNPKLLELIADIMGAAPRLQQALAKSRRVLDAILDPGSLDMSDDAALGAFIRAEIAAAAGFEEALDRARALAREQSFLVAVGMLSGAASPAIAARAFSAIAEGAIAALQTHVQANMERAHGVIPGGGACVVAMGKLGGREMTAASDLDLILVYDHERGASMSASVKPLAPSAYYSRYTQRLISALSAPTAEGPLYQVDMRLRPSGNAGPVATSLPAFADYQQNQAWTWEHMALTRARVVSGPETLRKAIDAVIGATLTKPRDPIRRRADVAEMRGKLLAHKPAKSVWDVKLAQGGLVDVEFIAQYLQLAHAAEAPGVLRQNTVEALTALREEGALQPDAANRLIRAAELYNAVTQITRACVDGPFDPSRASGGLLARIAEACGAPDFARAEAELRDTAREVSAVFEAHLGSAGAHPARR
ncbi:MAG: bifunctional [glutamine synthetase] adenylyltransferase/[glutamine synthetase]-adenylyl-L-tyrosine phosphorylase [Hyphomicrobiales bacterium]|nr:bifunctional [glutamine synthetase] adenylyltransferase/[glutamine synthetase]-adenylyl-L-tyrosine phosphorylase [Hyphomicrobiales bacterium]